MYVVKVCQNDSKVQFLKVNVYVPSSEFVHERGLKILKMYAHAKITAKCHINVHVQK